jgi:hypothetical protein
MQAVFAPMVLTENHRHLRLPIGAARRKSNRNMACSVCSMHPILNIKNYLLKE